MFKKFWEWYERHYQLNLVISTGLFLLQIFHLYWMTTFVVANILFGKSFFFFPTQFTWFYALVDYTEIPALISVSLVYIHDIQKSKSRFKFKSWLYLFFLNIQFVHLFWITDDVVLRSFLGVSPVAIPKFLALVAIAIDYLELPVMVETVRKTIGSIFGSSSGSSSRVGDER